MTEETKPIPESEDETIATWTVELNTYCPNCKEWVDLLEAPDFWEGRQLEVGEHETDNSRDVEVQCPKCWHEFIVTLEY